MENIKNYIKSQINESVEGEVEGVDLTKPFIYTEFTEYKKSSPRIVLYINPASKEFAKFVKEVAKAKVKKYEFKRNGSFRSLLLAPAMQKNGMNIAQKYPGEFLSLSFDYDPDCVDNSIISDNDVPDLTAKGIQKWYNDGAWSTCKSYDYISWDEVYARWEDFQTQPFFKKYLEELDKSW